MVQKFQTLADAIALAEYAHRHQLDKAGLPYIEHPRRVMAAVQGQHFPPYVQIAAILHDVTEDTAFSSDILLALGFSEAAVEVVRLVDRDHSQKVFADTLPSNQWIKGDFKEQASKFYYQQIKKNPGALAVKLADIDDNLLPWRQSYLPQETQDRLTKKYAKAKAILLG